MDKYIYPAIFEKGEVKGYTVTFPDLPGAITEGDDMSEALRMAKECLELQLFGLEEDNEVIPSASDPASIQLPADSFITLIEVRMGTIRDEMMNKAVTKNVTLPRWLEQEATREKINFSQVLQHALKERLGVKDYPTAK
ncbi:pilus assembly protein HicB [Paenibacillus sp. lzh-N1]|uniref:Type II toxin-antitoxin system HicB family antitoxin n=1 Tax=Paenibacillus polymyxa TaxID=1406 RepID=A0AAE9IB79_PAEPO|nr:MULTISPECIES: type II toxin-antitoxin system HicB family antitoxin [Paenibacillus]AUO09571.1 pilus assembly protein HicB [Paenibacillus sp. lzh-N1]URJ50756.1 type II toxin-antitoxin system HicB family antitoxin [Paenibacillus polymyxa]